MKQIIIFMSLLSILLSACSTKKEKEPIRSNSIRHSEDVVGTEALMDWNTGSYLRGQQETGSNNTPFENSYPNGTVGYKAGYATSGSYNVGFTGNELRKMVTDKVTYPIVKQEVWHDDERYQLETGVIGNENQMMYSEVMQVRGFSPNDFGKPDYRQFITGTFQFIHDNKKIEFDKATQWIKDRDYDKKVVEDNLKELNELKTN